MKKQLTIQMIPPEGVEHYPVRVTVHLPQQKAASDLVLDSIRRHFPEDKYRLTFSEEV